MSVDEVIAAIEKFSSKEQEKVFSFMVGNLLQRSSHEPKRWLGRKLSFEEPCDVVFREKRELLSLSAK